MSKIHCQFTLCETFTSLKECAISTSKRDATEHTPVIFIWDSPEGVSMTSMSTVHFVRTWAASWSKVNKKKWSHFKSCSFFSLKEKIQRADPFNNGSCRKISEVEKGLNRPYSREVSLLNVSLFKTKIPSKILWELFARCERKKTVRHRARRRLMVGTIKITLSECWNQLMANQIYLLWLRLS